MKILKSFLYAFQGVKHCVVTQKNFRFHIVAAISVLIASGFYDFGKFEFLMLAATIMLVLICEMINTSIEATIDMNCSEYNINAKIAKDVSAAAVLMSALLAVAVAFVLFWDIDRICMIITYFIKKPLLLTALLLYAVLCVLFISGAPFKNNDR